MITPDFLLETDTAKELYHQHAAKMPIIDYHNHLDPQAIAEDRKFDSITSLWLGGDHYKWRALRANGVEEKYITGDADPYSKFMKWAETVPYTMRNPLYHWTHLELKRYFDISDLLKKETGEKIYHQCNEQLMGDDFSVKNLLLRMKVEVLCTTDDPVDSLEYHRKIAADGFVIKVLPTWRPDKLLAIDHPTAFIQYIDKLSEVSGVKIENLQDLIIALEKRQDYFAEHGCRVSDHGLYRFPDAEFSDAQLEKYLKRLMQGEELNETEAEVFRAGMLYHLAAMNYRKGWVQQFHIGAIRNNNYRLFQNLGPDIGGDSIADEPVAAGLSKFLGRLDLEGKLTKTILYNLNPKDSDVLLSMAYNYNDGKTPGKMQYGAAWWFLDQMDGMIRQLNILSSGGLLSRFVGMLTDSRSFLSFPRHEYFRRILCNVLGNDIEKGLLPVSEMAFIGGMVEDICYKNIKQYINIK